MADNTHSFAEESEKVADKATHQRIPRKNSKSFIEALEQKYLSKDEHTLHFVQIVFHGRAELGHLTNMVLSNNSIRTAGLEGQGLKSLSPNVVDLDLSGNLLESWVEVLTIMSNLDKLKFVNLAKNKLSKDTDCLNSWHCKLPQIENLVLNTTGTTWPQVLLLAKLLPGLQELHVCGNDYAELPDSRYICMSNVECLRLNNNKIERWEEVWKLRYLPKLKSLVLSGNPLKEIFFVDDDIDLQHGCHFHYNSNTNFKEFICLEETNNVCPEDIVHSVLNEIVKNAIADVSDQQTEINQRDGTLDRVKDSKETHDECFNQGMDTWCREILDNIVNGIEKESSLSENMVNLNQTSSCINTENCGDNVMCTSKNGSKHICHPSSEDQTSGGNCCSTYETGTLKLKPFGSLETLCISETKICKWKHLSALRMLAMLKSLSAQRVKLGSNLNDEDRRRFFIACLPHVSVLNGSEVTSSEREKAERHFLRHFFGKKNKPDIYSTLESKHGNLTPLVDIDIMKGYQAEVTLTFIYQGKVTFVHKVCVREAIGTLRTLVATKLKVNRRANKVILYHKYCNPDHQDLHPGGYLQLEEMAGDSLPLSRMDLLEGDEIHVDVVEKSKHEIMMDKYRVEFW